MCDGEWESRPPESKIPELVRPLLAREGTRELEIWGVKERRRDTVGWRKGLAVDARSEGSLEYHDARGVLGGKSRSGLEEEGSGRGSSSSTTSGTLSRTWDISASSWNEELGSGFD